MYWQQNNYVRVRVRASVCLYTRVDERAPCPYPCPRLRRAARYVWSTRSSRACTSRHLADRRAGQAVMCCCCCCSCCWYRGDHSITVLLQSRWKQSGIPSVVGRGCASGPERVPGTITRRGALPPFLSLSPCPHRGNNRTGWGQFGYYLLSSFCCDRMAGAKCLLKTPR